MIRTFLAGVAGIAIGFIGVVLHNAAVPYGLGLALLESAVGIWLVGRFWGVRWLKVPAILGWLAIVMRAGTHGASFELLVMGNDTGEIFLLAGLGVVIAAGLVRS